MNTFKGKDILAIADLTPEEVRTIYDTAVSMEPYANREKITRVLEGAVLANLFFEPSTRSRVSFGTAFNRLGGEVRDTAGAQTTSMAKGESLHDTGRAIGGYADSIVVRHSKTGAAQEIADATDIPVINAGDGIGEHPTQALLDVYTIEKRLGDPSGKTIAIIGDLKFGRTTHSLTKLLGKMYDNMKFKFIAPEDLQMPVGISDEIQALGKGHDVDFMDDINGIGDADIIYSTRTQEERFSSPDDFEKYRGKLKIDKGTVDKLCKPEVVIMHPLPRDSREDSNELSHDLNGDPRLAIFDQTDNGIPVRMALFALTLDVVDQVEKTARPVNWHVPIDK